MGQQQILLLLLTVVIVFLSIALSLNLFRTYSIQQSKNQCLNELNYMRARTSDYYKTSKSFGGTSFGNYNWDAISISKYINLGWDGANNLETENALYNITLDGDEVTFLADVKDEWVPTNIQLVYNVVTVDTKITYPPR